MTFEVSNMTWEDIIKQTDEYQEPSEEEELEELLKEFYENMQYEIENALENLAPNLYKDEKRIKQVGGMLALREPKMKEFMNNFFEGVNLLRKAQRIAEGED
tara:strand:- start:25 stop:330 length:306 start_codon:yes stop_codon:yes gene_type:complete